jgi:hypothetical protein
MGKAPRKVFPRERDRRLCRSRLDIVRRDLMPRVIRAWQREAVLEIFQTDLPRDKELLPG